MVALPSRGAGSDGGGWAQRLLSQGRDGGWGDGRSAQQQQVLNSCTPRLWRCSASRLLAMVPRCIAPAAWWHFAASALHLRLAPGCALALGRPHASPFLENRNVAWGDHPQGGPGLGDCLPAGATGIAGRSASSGPGPQTAAAPWPQSTPAACACPGLGELGGCRRVHRGRRVVRYGGAEPALARGPRGAGRGDLGRGPHPHGPGEGGGHALGSGHGAERGVACAAATSLQLSTQARAGALSGWASTQPSLPACLPEVGASSLAGKPQCCSELLQWA